MVNPVGWRNSWPGKTRITRQIITKSKVNDPIHLVRCSLVIFGKALFIPGLLPEESAEVIIQKIKAICPRARISRRLNDSPERKRRAAHLASAAVVSNSIISIALQQRSKARRCDETRR